MQQGCRVLEAAGERYGFDLDFTGFSIGADRYLATGEAP